MAIQAEGELASLLLLHVQDEAGDAEEEFMCEPSEEVEALLEVRLGDNLELMFHWPDLALEVAVKHQLEQELRFPMQCLLEGSVMEVNMSVRGDSDEEMKMQFVLDVGTEGMDDEMVVLSDCDSELSNQAVDGALMPVQDQCEALQMAEKQAKSSACVELDADKDVLIDVGDSLLEGSSEDEDECLCYEGASEVVFGSCGAWDVPLSRTEKVLLSLLFHEREVACNLQEVRKDEPCRQRIPGFAHHFTSTWDFPLSRREKIQRLLQLLS